MPQPQPQNFNDVTDFTSQIEKNYPGGWDKLPHEYQENYISHAISDWQRYHQMRQNIKAETAASFADPNATMTPAHPGKMPGMSRGTGPETPGQAMAPDAGAGASIASRFAGTVVPPSEPSRGEVEPAMGGRGMNDWLEQNVSRPMQRETIRGLAYMAANSVGAPAGPWVNKVMSDPKLYSQYKDVASYVPLLGAGTPSGQAFDAVMLGLDPALKAAGIVLPAMEGRKFMGPLTRFALREGITGVAGAATEIPNAMQQQSAVPLGIGFGKGVAAQTMIEGASGALSLVGAGARMAANRAFQNDMIDSVAGTGTYLKDMLGNKLKSWGDFADNFVRTKVDAYNNARSGIELQTNNVIKSLEKRGNALMAGTEFETKFPDPDMLEERGIRGSMTAGAQAGEQPVRAATPEKKIPATPRHKNPLWVPGPQKKGGPPKAPYWTKGWPARTVPGKEAVEPGTFKLTWEDAFQTMRNWEKRGWEAFNHPSRGQAGEVARSLARFMRKELAAQMDAAAQGTGAKWLTAKTQEEAGHLFTNIFSTEGVLEGLRKGDAGPLQRAVAGLPKNGREASSYMRDIIEVLDGDGSKNGTKFLSRVMHGGGVTAPKDVAGAISPYVSGHMTGFRIGVHPTLPYTGGRTGVDVGRGTWGLIGKMGAATLFKSIEQALSDPNIDREAAGSGP